MRFKATFSTTTVPAVLICILIPAGPALSQGRGGTDWSTAGGDAQRSGWVRTDPKISVERMGRPGFQLMWKVKLGGALSAPSLQDRYIGYRGFRSYAFVGGSSNSVYALDTDLGRVEWQKRFPVAAPAGTAACPGGMTAGVTRPVAAAFPAMGGGRGPGGGGRGGPAKSGVGAPLEGAVTIPPSIAANAAGGPGGRGRGPGGPPQRMAAYTHALSSDGAFHSMYVSNGEEPKPPVKFLPANANAGNLTVVDEVAYVTTSGNCGGVPNGVWALDIATGAVTSWKGDVAGSVPAFGPDGTVYVATATELAALEPKSLTKRSSYSAGQAFAGTPVIFENKGAVIVAGITMDGTMQLFDPARPAAIKSAATDAASGALATWQDSNGTRWILAGTGNNVTAWKVGDQSLSSGWKSKDVGGAVSLAVVNGVVFAVSKTTLFALNGATGKDLWSSGTAITSSPAHGGGLATGGSSVYLGTQDGTLWAFGFPIEH